MLTRMGRRCALKLPPQPACGTMGGMTKSATKYQVGQRVLWQGGDVVIRQVKRDHEGTFYYVDGEWVEESRLDDAARLALWPELVKALERVQFDTNWMLNNRKFLNGDSLDYLEFVLAKARELE
jgi:hypothetical protein